MPRPPIAAATRAASIGGLVTVRHEKEQPQGGSPPCLSQADLNRDRSGQHEPRRVIVNIAEQFRLGPDVARVGERDRSHSDRSRSFSCTSRPSASMRVARPRIGNQQQRIQPAHLGIVEHQLAQHPGQVHTVGAQTR